MAKETDPNFNDSQNSLNSTNEKNFDLEKAMQHLEKIVGRLDSGNIGLDEAFRLFEEGSRLSEKINKKINSYEKRLKILNEQYEIEDFDEETLINGGDSKDN